LKNNFNIETAPLQNCCREKEWHKERRERESQGTRGEKNSCRCFVKKRIKKATFEHQSTNNAIVCKQNPSPNF